MAAISVLPAPLDLTLYSGDGVSLLLTFKDSVTGNPYPVAGAWTAQVRPKNGGQVVTEFAIDDSSAALGEVRLSLTGAQVRSIPNGCVWDLEQVPSGGEPRTWYKGTIKVTADVTQVGVP